MDYRVNFQRTLLQIHSWNRKRKIAELFIARAGPWEQDTTEGIEVGL